MPDSYWIMIYFFYRIDVGWFYVLFFFFMAAVTNDQKLNGLRQQEFVVL